MSVQKVTKNETRARESSPIVIFGQFSASLASGFRRCTRGSRADSSRALSNTFTRCSELLSQRRVLELNRYRRHCASSMENQQLSGRERRGSTFQRNALTWTSISCLAFVIVPNGGVPNEQCVLAVIHMALLGLLFIDIE